SAQERLNSSAGLGELQSIIELLMNAEIVQAAADRVVAGGNLDFGFDYLILAVRTAVAASEELQKPVDGLRLAGADCPVQTDQPAAARGQLAERFLSASIGSDPAGALGKVEDDAISLGQEFRSLFPRIVRPNDCYFQPGYRFETLGQNPQAGHVL